jgi:pyridoxal phosphate enzyme (YggS family)
MEFSQIRANVEKIRTEISSGNSYGEKVTLVAATKMQSAERINAAIAAGVEVIAENKPQEFRDKNEFISPCTRHFIGHLQTNKIKYLIGKVSLIHSCDRDELIEEIAKQSIKNNVVTGILLQINIGNESSKGGYAYEDAKNAFLQWKDTHGICVKGFMAMLPESDDETLLRGLAKKMRALFDWGKTQSESVEFLSMGMSGDYALCMQEGSNMIRLGSTIFGHRDYGEIK